MKIRITIVCALIGALGCNGILGGDPIGDERPDVICEPSLTLEPQNANIAAGGILIMRAMGGTGEYRYILEGEALGSRIHDQTGVLVAGEEATEVMVRVQDRGWPGRSEQYNSNRCRFFD